MITEILIFCVAALLICWSAMFFTGSNPTSFQSFLNYMQNKRRERDILSLSPNEAEKYKQNIKDLEVKI